MDRDRLRASVAQHEGFRSKPYRDTEGVLTIGYGTNLDEGISEAEAYFLMCHRLTKCEADARASIPTFRSLSPLRQEVLVEMRYNLGLGGVLGFRKMISCLRARDFDGAAREMLDSLWARQVGQRAQTLAERMRRG